MNTLTQEKARAIRATTTPAAVRMMPDRVGAIARQGDCVIRRIEGPITKQAEGIALLADGAHGAHVALGPLAWSADGILRVGEGGIVVIVHTDEPHARHVAVGLHPGNHVITGLRERTSAGFTTRVQD